MKHYSARPTCVLFVGSLILFALGGCGNSRASDEAWRELWRYKLAGKLGERAESYSGEWISYGTFESRYEKVSVQTAGPYSKMPVFGIAAGEPTIVLLEYQRYTRRRGLGEQKDNRTDNAIVCVVRDPESDSFRASVISRRTRSSSELDRNTAVTQFDNYRKEFTQRQEELEKKR